MKNLESKKIRLFFKESNGDYIKDWSPIPREFRIPSSTFVADNMNNTDEEFMGLFKTTNNTYRTSGTIGVGWLKDSQRKTIIDDTGNACAILIKPRFKVLDPWEMLAEVFADPEYENYILENGPFYKFNVSEKMIPIPSTEKGGEFLAALSFLNICSKLCRRHLSRQISFTEENLNGKIIGSIDMAKHIKYNVSKGREDRIYCRYPTFTLDNLENRIVKAALIKSHRIIQSNHAKSENINRLFSYCLSSLKTVRTVKISKSDFNKINTTGCNSNYKPVIELAKTILFNKGIYDLFNSNTVDEYRFVIPYTINMERLFEFYIRSIIKKKLQNERNSLYKLDTYRSKDTNPLKVYEDNPTKKVYLMNSYIPDISIYTEIDGEKKYIAVFDVKYQHSTNQAYASSIRHNTHQLLFYTLLLNVKTCGFIFPSEQYAESIEDGISLNIMNGNRIKNTDENIIKYYQLLMNLTSESDCIKSVNQILKVINNS